MTKDQGSTGEVCRADKRVLIPIDEQQRRIRSSDIDAAVKENLSRLIVFDADLPVRFEPPNNPPPAEPRMKFMPDRGPQYFFSGNSQGSSRTVYHRKYYAPHSRV